LFQKDLETKTRKIYNIQKNNKKHGITTFYSSN
jgi:hypothetical protein